MSDDWVVVIPEDPNTVPSSESQQLAREFLARLAPNADKIIVSHHDQIQFVDCGANFSDVFCPSCKTRISSDWWQERMTEDYADGFRLRDYPTPCCGVSLTLNDLVYDWPQGFARFSIEVINPSIGRLADSARRGLSAVLGVPVRLIYRHI